MIRTIISINTLVILNVNIIFCAKLFKNNKIIYKI